MKAKQPKFDQSEIDRVLRYLARMPSGTATLRRNEARELLAQTSGWFIAQGHGMNLVLKHLGLGIYHVTAKLRHP